MWRLVAVALLALPLGSSVVLAEDMKLPPLKKQPTPQAVIDEHIFGREIHDVNSLPLRLTVSGLSSNAGVYPLDGGCRRADRRFRLPNRACR